MWGCLYVGKGRVYLCVEGGGGGVCMLLTNKLNFRSQCMTVIVTML